MGLKVSHALDGAVVFVFVFETYRSSLRQKVGTDPCEGIAQLVSSSSSVSWRTDLLLSLLLPIDTLFQR
jgi:hypothetical protein